MSISFLWNKLDKLRLDRRGNVMMIMGFAIIPLTFAVGMTVDYSRAARLQTKLNAVADASGLAATTTPMFKKPWQTACGLARNTFVNGATGLEGLTINPSTASDLTITLKQTYAVGSPDTFTCPVVAATPTGSEVSPLSREATVTYNAKSANAFGGVLKSSTIDIGGTSTARVSTAPYIDIYMALDTSQSMGLASTDAQAQRLYTLTKAQTKEGCTFGCHVPKSGERVSNETIARNNNVELRVDVLKNATVDMIQTAINEQKDKQLYRFGLYRIGQSMSEISKLTTDLIGTKNVASGIGLGPNDAGGTGDTNLADMTTNLFAKIEAKGNGETQQKARPFVFIVTDGVIDIKGNCTSGHCTAPIDPKTCQKYKDAGVTVGVVYTTYLPIKANPADPNSTTLQIDYINLVKTFSTKDENNQTQTEAQIATNLRACASNGWFFEASDGPAIHAAIQKLFEQASQTPTVTH